MPGVRNRNRYVTVQKHILIVEDEPAIRDMVAFALRKAGMEAMHAVDARAAQTAISERVPDLILLDWMLPGMSGIDLARRLRSEEHTSELQSRENLVCRLLLE